MEQILTTAALIAGGIFAMWILFADPGDEEGKGEMNTAMLGALLMVPVIILLIIGIVLLLPVILGIILVIAIAFGAYVLLRKFLTRERSDSQRDEKEQGESRNIFASMFRGIRKTSRSVMDSRPGRALRSATRSATTRTRETLKSTGKSLRKRVSDTTKRVREKGPQRVRETMRKLRSSDPRDHTVSRSVREVFVKSKKRIAQARESLTKRSSQRRTDKRSDRDSVSFVVTDVHDEERGDVIVSRSQKSSTQNHRTNSSMEGAQKESAVSDRVNSASSQKSRRTVDNIYSRNQKQEGRGKASLSERLLRWRGALKKKPGRIEPDGDDLQDRTASKRVAKKHAASERGHAHDPIQNMRKIGWNTRKHLGEVYHHRKR